MKRRAFIGAVAVVPAAASTALAQPPATPAPAPGQGAGGGQPRGLPVAPAQPDPVTYTSPDAAATTVARFFTPAQFAALERLAALFEPGRDDAASAADAGAAPFLDFHVSRSPVDRQTLYRAGLDGLNARAKKACGKLFGETDDSQADAVVMEFLSRPWSYAPADPIEAFLRTALRDVRRATQNSPAFAASLSAPPMSNWLRPL